MQTGLKHMHSGLAYLVLLSIIIAIVYFLLKFLGKKSLTSGDKKFALIPMILTHIQFLIGIITYIATGRFKGFSEAMSVPEARLLAIEHPLINIIGIALITIGYSKVKRKIGTGQPAGFEFLFFLLGLLLILSRIHWSSWIG